MEQEIFKPIKGYECYYEISNLGRVKSLPKVWSVGKKKETILKNGHRKTGYDFVVLCIDKIKKYASVHRLVAEHFCDKIDGCNVVNHINSNKLDNRAKNLEWTTSSGNSIHGFKYGFRKGMKGGIHHNSKLTDTQILDIKEMYKKGNISQEAIGKIYGVKQTQISRIVLGKRWNHI